MQIVAWEIKVYAKRPSHLGENRKEKFQMYLLGYFWGGGEKTEYKTKEMTWKWEGKSLCIIYMY